MQPRTRCSREHKERCGQCSLFRLSAGHASRAGREPEPVFRKGFGGRALYSDHDEAIFDATCPIVFNAIPDLAATRQDFLDRAVVVEFLDMTRAMRRDEAQFWPEFEEARPRILGALLDAVAAGLRNLPNIKLAQPPRMADFAIWVNACEESLEMKPGEALAAYQYNLLRRTTWRLSPRLCTNRLPNWPKRALAGRSPNCMRGSPA